MILNSPHMKSDALEARKITAPRKSSGSPHRPVHISTLTLVSAKGVQTSRSASYNILCVLCIVGIDFGQGSLDVTVSLSAWAALFETGNGQPGTYAIHIDAMLGPFIAHCFGHLKNASLGASIGSDVVIGNKGDDRGNVDNLIDVRCKTQSWERDKPCQGA